MVTFNLSAPFQVGTMLNPVSVSSLQVTGLWFTKTPAIAALGTGELEITLTDPVSGWQETIQWNDATIPTIWQAQTVTSDSVGHTIEDLIAVFLLGKAIADGKLPAGNISAG